jgi:hypothetical protein
MKQESRESVVVGTDIYDLTNLMEDGQLLVAKIRFVELKLQELKNRHALLTKAKNAYVADLKNEIVRGKSGISLGELFTDD